MKRFFAILWYVLTLKCEEAERVRCCDSDEPVYWWQRWAEVLHRIACKSCRRARREIDALNATLRDLVQAEQEQVDETTVEAPLSPDARQRIAQALREAERDRHA